MYETKVGTLRVPGASLYYEMRGSGPVLLISSDASECMFWFIAPECLHAQGGFGIARHDT